MVSTVTLVLAGVVAYTLAAMALRARGVVPEFIRFSGPITTIHTQRGKALLDRLAAPRRFWRAWGNLGVGVALVVMVGSFLVVALGAYQAIVDPQPSALNEPQNALAIPGVNDFLPLSVAPEILFGLALGLIVHEGGHGLLCRVEGIDIESMGLALLTVVPVGAFVEPDEEELLRSDRGSQTRMYAAGVTNNFALSLLALLLLFGPVAGSIAVVDGVPVGGTLQGTPAAASGIGSGDVITAVDGQPVADGGDLERVLAATDDRTVEVSLKDGDSATVQRQAVVARAVASAPLAANDTIARINGTAVYTQRDVTRAAANNTVGLLETADGETVTYPLGAYVLVQPDEAFERAGAPAREGVIVTSVDGQRVARASDLGEALSGTSPGDTVDVVAYVPDGQGYERERYTVELGADDQIDGGVLGVQVQGGVSGLGIDDFGIDEYPAGAFLELIGGPAQNPDAPRDINLARQIYITVLLPFVGAAPGGGFSYSFAGFTGFAANFYTVQGPLALLGRGGAFFLANALFWTGWINVVIGQFNCVPTFPLDGGHILRTTTEAFASRVPVPDRRRLTTAVTVAVTMSMIGGLLLMVFGPRLFA